MRKIAFTWGLLLLAALSACGTKVADFEVVRVFPPDGYHGFTKNEVIEIEFSAPVDRSSLAAAYRSDSNELKPDRVTFTFLEGDRKLRITPKTPLDYSNSSAYRLYRFEIGTELRDTRGRPLKEPLSVTFTTLRLFKVQVPSLPQFDGIIAMAQTSTGTQLVVSDDATYLAAGDGDHDETFFGYLGFPFPEDLVEPAGAYLRLYSPIQQGAPFQHLGRLGFELMDLGDELSSGDALNPPLVAVSVFEDGSGYQTGTYFDYELTDYLNEALNRGLARLDLRLAFENRTNGDSSADAVFFFTREAVEQNLADADLLPVLILVYYAP